MSIHVEKFGQALAQSRMLPEEKEAWLRALPHMRSQDVQRLYDALQREVQEVDHLAAAYRRERNGLISHHKAGDIAKILKEKK